MISRAQRRGFQERPECRAGGVLRLGLLLCLSFLALRADPIPLEELSTDHVVQSFTVEDGLPQNSVTKITQTPDGYIWFSTYRGLGRFDGVRFTVFDSGNTPAILGDDSVEALQRDHRGHLSVVMKGGGLLRVVDGVIRRANGTRGLPDEPLRLRGESPDGRAHVAVLSSPLVYVETEEGNFVARDPDGRVEVRNMDDVAVDGDARPWYRGTGRWIEVQAGDLLPLVPPDSPTNSTIHILCKSRKGGIWLVAEHGIHLWEDHRWVRSIQMPEPMAGCAAIVEDRSGMLWIATWTQGLWRLDPDGRFHRYQISRGARPEAVRALFEDTEGNLWIGSEASGLFRLGRKAFQTIGSAQGLSGELVRSVAVDLSGSVWLVNQAGVESFLPGTRPAIRRAAEVTWCVYGDSAGRAWMGAYAGGVYRLEGDRWVTVEPNSPQERNTITVLFEEPGTGMWVGRENGLWRVSGTNLVREVLPETVAGLAVRSLALDRRSRLWLGLDGGGLLCRESGSWKRVPIPGSPQSLTVSALLADSEDTLWVGTSVRGLYRVRQGRVSRLDAGVDGLPRRPSSLLEDGLGFVWIGSTDGIFRVKRDDLNAWADGSRRDVVPRRFGRGDGLETSECSSSIQPAAWRAPDNRLWFATYRGVSVVDPARLGPEPPPPPVLIEESVLWGRGKTNVSIAGGPALESGSDAAAIIVPADTYLMEIHYTATRFKSAERVRFRYRLEELDPDWVDAGARRVAYYQELSAGTYHFQVTACNQDGIWNDRTARLTVVKQPRFWETWPFRAALALGLAGAGIVAYRFRIRALTRAKSAQEEYSRRLIASLELERQRVARELHDSLGQNLLVIKNRVALAQQQSAQPGKAAEQLREAAEVTSQAIREVREISQDLRPFQLDELGLSKAISANVRKLSAASQIRIEAEIGDLRGALPPAQEIHLYRIVQECLNNVIKHSLGTLCRVAVARSGNAVLVVVEDNGCGFGGGDRVDAADSGAGNGLSNIRERARILGGHAEFLSRPGEGTRVTVTVPLPA
jgi:signal transduction histidine kinase/ligand-binding sensor domain-containing protein